MQQFWLDVFVFRMTDGGVHVYGLGDDEARRCTSSVEDGDAEGLLHLSAVRWKDKTPVRILIKPREIASIAMLREMIMVESGRIISPVSIGPDDQPLEPEDENDGTGTLRAWLRGGDPEEPYKVDVPADAADEDDEELGPLEEAFTFSEGDSDGGFSVEDTDGEVAFFNRRHLLLLEVPERLVGANDNEDLRAEAQGAELLAKIRNFAGAPEVIEEFLGSSVGEESFRKAVMNPSAVGLGLFPAYVTEDVWIRAASEYLTSHDPAECLRTLKEELSNMFPGSAKAVAGEDFVERALDTIEKIGAQEYLSQLVSKLKDELRDVPPADEASGGSGDPLMN